MFRIHWIKLISFFLVSLFWFSAKGQAVLDLRKSNLSETKINLNTTWDFYWEELKNPGSFDDQTRLDSYFFPKLWNGGQTQNGQWLTRYGFATYRLQVLLPETHEQIALKLQDYYSAYRFYVNGKLLAENGRVGLDEGSSKGGWKQLIVDIPDTSRLDIVLQISNFQHAKGGAKESIFIGEKEILQAERQLNLAYDLILTGGFFLTGLFFLSSFLFLGYSRINLFFSLFCIIFSYRIIGSDEYAVQLLVPDLPWHIQVRLEYIALFLAPAFFGLFTYKLFPKETSRKVVKVFTSVCLALTLIAAFFPTTWFTHLAEPYLIFLLPLILYASLVYYRAFRVRRTAAKLAVISGIVVFALFAYKILIFLLNIQENEFFTFLGFMLFLFFESLILFHLFTDSLKRAKDIAEQASKSKSTFLSMMSHEIRTPMNAVIGLTNFIMDDNPKKEHLETLNTLRFSAQNLLVIINDILDLSKIEAQKIEFEKRPVNLYELAKSLKRIFSPIAKQKGIHLNIDFDMRVPPFILCDPTRISQILTNLINNAVKFTKQGGVDVIVEQVEKVGDQITLLFKVKDSGIGIPQEKIETIFDSFTQASSNTTREFGGTGLGLTITKKLLQLQGVTLQLESEVGVGTTFSFEQTFEVSTKEQIIAQLDPVKPLPLKLEGEILLVEDNQINVMVAKKFLHKWGVSVTVAENGQEAVELTHTRNFDLILMDLQMPVMDGYQATKALRARGLKTPIIALTASALLDEQNKIFNAGMDDFVIKPFDPDELLAKIIKYIELGSSKN